MHFAEMTQPCCGGQGGEAQLKLELAGGDPGVLARGLMWGGGKGGIWREVRGNLSKG